MIICKHCGVMIVKTSGGIWRHGSLGGWASCENHKAGFHISYGGNYARPLLEEDIVDKILTKYSTF